MQRVIPLRLALLYRYYPLTWNKIFYKLYFITLVVIVLVFIILLSYFIFSLFSEITFKCCLQAHLKSHLYKCKNCKQRFRRIALFKQHQVSLLMLTMNNSYLHLLLLFNQVNHRWTILNFLSKLSKLFLKLIKLN